MFNLSTEKPYSLDITDFKETGIKLKQAINKAVKDTQSAIVRAYPNKIIMTQAQYDNLRTRPEVYSMGQFDGQDYYLYRTPSNIMEIEVK